MQKVEAMIKPSRLEEIKRALSEIGINGMTVNQETGDQRHRSYTGMTRETGLQEEVIPQIKIDIIVESSLVEPVLSVIAEHATAFPFVFLNVFGCVSSSQSVTTTETSVNRDPALPRTWPPEPAL
ncbi:hypothetical protein DSLASN_13380 [Desulfoluna limicola]|uniref:Nitrogen regulatory protein P-II n=1 Tax=Desulfoluna limicola TaxID=2810562 RepID=A0ABM7PF63_9BACT|nr:P-II family nitrogen regulator [Desulfoluna limicola]BCS95706.1 hypothetical protein DSLASN_13380 [Desulfoluna limicola]